MEYSLYHKLSQIALHERKAELVLRNAMIADVFTDEIRRADIAVADGYIAAVGGSYEGTEEIDLNGKYVLPGFMDAHLHLESTMVTPNELITAAALCGTTTFIVDPHEAANVSGTEGIDYILDQTEHSPANVFVMMPSCVPATEYDDNGCLLTAEKMAPYLSSPRILGLGEVMNAPGVIHGDRQLHKKLELFSGRILDGHAPYLPDDELTAYALAGIRTDHEASDFDYALEEIRRGIHVHIREGSAAHNLETLINGILAHDLPCENFSFCTDDKHIEDILRQGHINYNVRRAVELGLSPMAAIKMATINTARCYGLKELGAVAPGYQADLIVTDDLSSFRILSVYHKGRLIDPSVRPETAACPDSLKNTVHVRPLSSDAFRLPITEEEVPVIRLNASQITTSKIACHLPKTDNYLPQDGFNKIAAVERHKATGKTGVGICTGYNIRNGAIASSVSHDSHNIIVIGDNDADMLLAVSEIIRVQGGYTLVSRGKVLGTLPLPVMGLMSEAGFETVNRTLGQMIAEAHRLGIPDEVEPFITLSFLALPVIPEIRITPRGVLDTVSFEFLSY
ncbi:MAG TPA: adenine deaminase [Candidatus Mediterraneibacter caccogallinarum]|nr:adenine deaminase [Candidatus Mediterraneibacter caccogallinarum]